MVKYYDDVKGREGEREERERERSEGYKQQGNMQPLELRSGLGHNRFVGKALRSDSSGRRERWNDGRAVRTDKGASLARSEGIIRMQ